MKFYNNNNENLKNKYQNLKRKIILGLDKNLNLDKKNKYNITNYYIWKDWRKAGFTQYDVNNAKNDPNFCENYGLAFKEVIANAEEVYFILDDLEELEVYGDWAILLQKGKKGFCEKNITRAELYVIATCPDFLKKTQFYYNNNLLQKIKIENNIEYALQKIKSMETINLTMLNFEQDPNRA